MFTTFNLIGRPLTYVPRTFTGPQFTKLKFFHSSETPQLLDIFKTQGLAVSLKTIQDTADLSKRDWLYRDVSDVLVKKDMLKQAENIVAPLIEDKCLRDGAFSNIFRGWLKHHQTAQATLTVKKIQQPSAKQMALMSLCETLVEKGELKEALDLASKDYSLINLCFQRHFERYGLVETIRCFSTVEIHDSFSNQLFNKNRNINSGCCDISSALTIVQEITGKNKEDQANRQDYARLQILYNACTTEALKILPQISNIKLQDLGKYHVALQLCDNIDRQSEAVHIGNSITDIVLRKDLVRAAHSAIHEQNNRTKSVRSLGIRKILLLLWNEKENIIQAPVYTPDEFSRHLEIVIADNRYDEYWKKSPTR